MFKVFKADVPLYLPGQELPVHCILDVDMVERGIGATFIAPREFMLMLEQYLVEGGLTGMHLSLTTIRQRLDEASVALSKKELDLAGKLTDAGMSEQEAEDWVREIVLAAFHRGQEGPGL